MKKKSDYKRKRRNVSGQEKYKETRVKRRRAQKKKKEESGEEKEKIHEKARLSSRFENESFFRKG